MTWDHTYTHDSAYRLAEIWDGDVPKDHYYHKHTYVGGDGNTYDDMHYHDAYGDDGHDSISHEGGDT